MSLRGCLSEVAFFESLASEMAEVRSFDGESYAGAGDESQGPTRLNVEDHSHFVEIGRDLLTARYTGKGSHAHDIGVIRADRPFASDVPVGYFEVTITSAGARGSIAVGVSTRYFPLNKKPGWEANSYGYFGDNGHVCHDGMQGRSFGPKFASGDVIGCGFHYARESIFFTRNGEMLGVAFHSAIPADYYPTVSMHSPGESVAFNFGRQPFAFDIQAYVRGDLDSERQAIDATPLEMSDLNRIVADFLFHYGYADAYASFLATNALSPSDGEPPGPSVNGWVANGAVLSLSDQGAANGHAVRENGTATERRNGQAMECSDGREGDGTESDEANATHMECDGVDVGVMVEPRGPLEIAASVSGVRERKRIRELVLSGDIRGAMAAAEKLTDGEVFADDDGVEYSSLRLRCEAQLVVELVKRGDTQAALTALSDSLGAYFCDELALMPEDASLLEDVAALLAYANPAESTVGYLLTRAHCDALADALNSRINEHLYGPSKSTPALERCLKQVVLARWVSREVSGGRGSIFRLSEYLSDANSRAGDSDSAL
eukprot:Opistho-1_new@28815